MILVGVAIMSMLYVFYAKPYAQAQNGTLLEQLTVATGEVVLALSYGLPLIIAGLLVWKSVKTFYRKDG
jgi:hypothetical protein